MNRFLAVFEQRVRGVRLIELVGFVLFLGMAFTLCYIKMHEDSDVKRLEALNRDIALQTEQVKVLRATVAQLEQPQRIEALASTYLGMTALDSKREAHLDSLVEISRNRMAGARGVDPIKTEPAAANVLTAVPAKPAAAPAVAGAGQ